MTAVTGEAITKGSQLHARRMPRWVYPVVAVLSLAATWAFVTTTKTGDSILIGVSAVAVFLIAMYVVSTIIEGRRAAKNRIATTLIWTAFLVALIPLISVAWVLISNGAAKFTPYFWLHSMNNVGPRDDAGGAYHAIIGTLEQAGIATIITVPLGILGAIYIVEYGRGWLTVLIRFFVDVMTGIPSIVAGLFILAFWVLVVSRWFNNGEAQRTGFAAALALSILMLPTVVRASEEMLRLVPAALREGAYALGVPKWKTILRIVLPTALPGIVTGVMLAIARAAGETAPVILVAGGAANIVQNPFSGQQESLSYFVYEQAGLSSKYAPGRAWAGALTLVVLVLVLTIAAKLLARRNKLAR